MTILPEQPAGRAGRSGRSPWLLVGVLAVAALVAAVVVFATRGGSGGTHRVRTTPAVTPHAWRVSIDAVSQPAPVNGRFVVYAADSGTLNLVGLDASSGRTAWTLPASPSGIAPGTAPEVAVVGNHVVYLKAADGAVEIAAADAATGAEVWHTAPGEFSGWPQVCPDDASAVCASGVVQGGAGGGALRVDAATGRILASPQVGPDARELAPDLFDVGQRNPEVMVATSGATLSWQQPLQRIFTFPGATTDYGWNFDRVARIGMYVGSVGAPPLTQTSARYSMDLGKAMTAGFRMKDGTPVWRDAGSQYVCGYLICPGATNPAYTSDSDARATGPTIGLRLRAHGVLSGSTTAIGATASRDAGGVLEGFDPATGHTRWKFDFGRDVGLLTQLRLPPRVSSHQIVLRTAAGRPVVVDVLTGQRVAAGGVSLAWCSTAVSYHMAVGYSAGGRTVHDYIGQYAVSPCRPVGGAATAPARGTDAMRGLFAETAGELAWMQKGAVVAVPA
jgi:outer membrane protein assembly factor BamB